MSMPRPCLDCGRLSATPRCAICRSALERRRNADPKRQAYRDPVYRAIPLAGHCALCGATEDLTRDHIVPLSRGGTNDPSNIRILCRTCNSARGNRA